MQIYGRKSNAWREFYNPLRGLSLPRLVSLLEAGERGQYADLQWFYHFMERSDAMVFSVIQRRRAALLACDWDVRVSAQVTGDELRVTSGAGKRGKDVSRRAAYARKLRPAKGDESVEKRPTPSRGRAREENRKGIGRDGQHYTDEGTKIGRDGQRYTGAEKRDAVLAEEQACCLREAYDGIENFRDAVGFLFSGFFRGYAHLEKHYGADGEIERLEPVEQWFWVRDGMFGDWEYNQNAVSGRRRGVPIERGDFVIFETVALNRILATLYLRRNLSQKDWDSFLEVFGIPSVFLVGPPNTPEAKEAEYQRIAESIIADGRGYLPYGSDLKFVTGGGGKPPFREHMEYLDRQITLAATGGLLTMLSESGSGTLAGGAHTETFLQIARGDAATLSEVFQRDVDGPLLAEAFPGRPALAYFEFAPPAGSEVSRVIQDAAALAGAGYPVEPGELSEKTGYGISGQ